MRRFSQRHNLTTLSEINVTPLLDLAFVLLIIFIITTPLMEKSVDIVIPSSVAAKNAVDPSAVQTVTLNRFAVIKLNDETVGIEQLEARLAELKQARPEIAVVVRAHKELPVQKLIDVMDALQRAQITRVGVVTNPEAE
jgi:biopolymer transport protein ExbD